LVRGDYIFSHLDFRGPFQGDAEEAREADQQHDTEAVNGEMRREEHSSASGVIALALKTKAHSRRLRSPW
jgi:hypothetical protein